MDRLPLLGLLNIFSGLLPLGAGVILWKHSTYPMKLLTILLFIGISFDTAGTLLLLKHVNNMFLFHLYTLVSYLFVALLFSYWHDGHTAFYIRLSIPIFFIIYLILLGLGYEHIKLPNKYSHSIESIFIAFITFFTLYTILKNHPEFPIHQNERFWVSFGAFLNYSGSVLVYAAIPVYITDALWYIHNTFVIVANIFYFRGYLCMRK